MEAKKKEKAQKPIAKPVIKPHVDIR